MRKQIPDHRVRFYAWILLIVFVSIVLSISVSFSADVAGQPAPTLVPPTLVPTIDAGINDALLSESALARVTANGKVRVGLYYNEAPFSELNIRNEVVGYDADIARSMAEAWGLTFEPVQVTEQTALDMLKSGVVDMLVSSQVHRRSLDFEVEFSQTYYLSSQSMLVRQDDGAASLVDMANRKIGYVVGSPSNDAIALWQQRTGIPIQAQQYLTLDQAYSALLNNEVDGIVDSRVHLNRIIPQPGMGKILDEPVTREPYAIVVQRQDVNWRNLINKTLQYLVRKGRMQEIQQTYFPNTKYPLNLVPVWGGVGDDPPKPDQFSADIPYPAQYAVPRIQSSGVVRVAGVADLPPDASEDQRRLDALNRAMIEAVAAKWGVRVEYIPNSADNAVDLVASGQADLAIGVPLDWALADRVDLTTPYLLHGDRLLAKKDSDVETFNDLRGRWVAVFASEPGSEDQVNELAKSVNSAVRIFTINHDDNVADAILNTSSH